MYTVFSVHTLRINVSLKNETQKTAQITFATKLNGCRCKSRSRDPL